MGSSSQDDDIDDIMSTRGPVSIRPEDDLPFSQKEEDVALRIDREMNWSKMRNSSVNVVSVPRVGGRGALADVGPYNGGGKSNSAGVRDTRDGRDMRDTRDTRGGSGGFFGGGGVASGRFSGGARSGGGGAMPAPPAHAALLLQPSQKKPISPPYAPPPAYSSLSRVDISLPNNVANKVVSGSQLRASYAGGRKSEEMLTMGREDGRHRGLSGLPGHPQQQNRSRPAR